MDIIEFDEPFISDIEGVSGSLIEPNEEVWRLACSPANAMAMAIPLNELRLRRAESLHVNDGSERDDLTPPEAMEVGMVDLTKDVDAPNADQGKDRQDSGPPDEWREKSPSMQ